MLTKQNFHPMGWNSHYTYKTIEKTNITDSKFITRHNSRSTLDLDIRALGHHSHPLPDTNTLDVY